ncbi:MAG: hypothetical protein AVDCRST_MAG73-1279, partial [uncultured Thermomicrobiales bacterium]
VRGGRSPRRGLPAGARVSRAAPAARRRLRLRDRRLAEHRRLAGAGDALRRRRAQRRGAAGAAIGAPVAVPGAGRGIGRSRSQPGAPDPDPAGDGGDRWGVRAAGRDPVAVVALRPRLRAGNGQRGRLAGVPGVPGRRNAAGRASAGDGLVLPGDDHGPLRRARGRGGAARSPRGDGGVPGQRRHLRRRRRCGRAVAGRPPGRWTGGCETGGGRSGWLPVADAAAGPGLVRGAANGTLAADPGHDCLVRGPGALARPGRRRGGVLLHRRRDRLDRRRLDRRHGAPRSGAGLVPGRRVLGRLRPGAGLVRGGDGDLGSVDRAGGGWLRDRCRRGDRDRLFPAAVAGRGVWAFLLRLSAGVGDRWRAGSAGRSGPRNAGRCRGGPGDAGGSEHRLRGRFIRHYPQADPDVPGWRCADPRTHGQRRL